MATRRIRIRRVLYSHPNPVPSPMKSAKGPESDTRSRFPAAVADPAACSPCPAFGVAQGAPPLGAFPGRGFVTEIEREPPLREMTSAAYTVGQNSIANAVAERCPVRLSSQRPRSLKGCPVKKVIPGTRRPGGALLDSGVIGRPGRARALGRVRGRDRDGVRVR